MRDSSQRSVDKMKESLRTHGFLRHDNPPSVVVPRAGRADGRPGPDLAQARILNGNLRLLAALDLWGPTFEMPFQVYFEFDSTAEAIAVAGGE